MNAQTQEQFFDLLDQVITEIVEAHVKDCETNADNYADLPKKRVFAYYGGTTRLCEYVLDQGINPHGIDDDTLSELVLDNFKMVPRSILEGTPKHVFSVQSYSLDQVETKIKLADLSKKIGQDITPEQFQEYLNQEYVNHAVEHDIEYSGGDCFKVCTMSDMMWCAEIEASELQQLINDYVGAEHDSEQKETLSL